MNIFTTIFRLDEELSEKIVNKAPWQTEKLILNKDHPFQGLFRRWIISLTKLFLHSFPSYVLPPKVIPSPRTKEHDIASPWLVCVFF